MAVVKLVNHEVIILRLMKFRCGAKDSVKMPKTET